MVFTFKVFTVYWLAAGVAQGTVQNSCNVQENESDVSCNMQSRVNVHKQATSKAGWSWPQHKPSCDVDWYQTQSNWDADNYAITQWDSQTYYLCEVKASWYYAATLYTRTIHMSGVYTGVTSYQQLACQLDCNSSSSSSLLQTRTLQAINSQN